MSYATPASSMTEGLYAALATPSFRAAMTSDPVAALRSFGVELDAADVPAQPVLASSETFARQHSSLQERDFDRKGPFSPFYLR